MAPRMLASLSALLLASGLAHAQQGEAASVPLPPVNVNSAAAAIPPAYASQAQTHTENADFGPLGTRSIQDAPYSITVVPEDVIVNQQARQVNDILKYLPCVEIRDQQGFDISRPQCRGFQGTVVQNTRMDGLNIIGTTAIAAENLSSVQVFGGLAASLYGPETPAGVFNYVLKRPTEAPIFRYVESFDSQGVFTEQIDAGGFTGPDNRIGYRINLVHGQGESYVQDSYVNRTLGSAAIDYHIDNQTVIETNYDHYAVDGTGLPGSIVYDGGKSTILPRPPNPTQQGIGQPGAGVNLRSDTGLVKFKHDFNNDWHLEIGGLYENAVRNLYGITNTMTNNSGNFTVTKNFNAVPRFTIASNSAALNGRFDVLGTTNELTIGTNGFYNGMYTYRNSIAQALGNSSLANPLIFPLPAVPANGGQFKSGYLFNQSIITGDTMHFNDQLAVQGVLSTSFLSSKSFAVSGATTSANSENGVVSPTVSLIYKPIPKLTTYFTYSNSVEQGETAPTNAANPNVILAPYHDASYEVGAKYAVFDNLLVTLDGFRMTRPLAFADPVTDIFQVEGTQRNYGIELFAQGSVTPELSVLGGVTWIDARLLGTNNVTTNDKLVVGVPHYKSDMLADYHPVFFQGGALTAALHYESARAATNTNNSFADSFVTFDLGARYSTTFETHHATFRLQVINVSNTRYYVSVADGAIVGSPGANTAYLGAPRTFEASLELDF
jgi:iron complex outermembrane receptor protein